MSKNSSRERLDRSIARYKEIESARAISAAAKRKPKPGQDQFDTCPFDEFVRPLPARESSKRIVHKQVAVPKWKPRGFKLTAARPAPTPVKVIMRDGKFV